MFVSVCRPQPVFLCICVNREAAGRLLGSERKLGHSSRYFFSHFSFFVSSVLPELFASQEKPTPVVKLRVEQRGRCSDMMFVKDDSFPPAAIQAHETVFSCSGQTTKASTSHLLQRCFHCMSPYLQTNQLWRFEH